MEKARATIQQGVAIKRSRALPGGLMLDFEDGEPSEESQYTEVWTASWAFVDPMGEAYAATWVDDATARHGSFRETPALAPSRVTALRLAEADR